jgi:predicted SnoaL-like aldol condensation-catalyzing enzyme
MIFKSIKHFNKKVDCLVISDQLFTFTTNLKTFTLMKKILLLFLSAGFIVSCSNMNSGNSKKEADNMAKMQRFYNEVINAHNPALADTFCAPNFVDHDPGPGNTGKGVDEVRKEFQQWFSMMPDVNIKTNFMIAKGDTVVSHVTISGNSMVMPGAPVVNKPYSASGVDIVVIKDGKATDRWGAFDIMGVMNQVGMMGGDANAAPADSSAMMGQAN